MKQHVGELVIVNPSSLPIGFMITYRECWCGARWVCPPLPDAEYWCPMAPAGSAPSQRPDNVLTVEITEPGWAADTPMPYAIGARVGSVITTLATANSAERALLIGHALWKTYAGKAEQFRRAWR